jgi:localization factor PodJL
MSHYGSWSVKGVDDRARAIAKEKARLKGVTLGDYINNLLLEGHSEAGPRDMYERPSAAPRHNPLDGLAQRIEAVEARSTLAITGIDQSVLGLLARLENTENSTSAMAAEVERMIDELRETHEALQDKVGTLEADDSNVKNLEAMKAFEDALGKLASHVYEEGRLTQDENAAMRGRVESGFSELNERVESMEVKVESTLSDAAQRVEKAVEQAELRSEGASRQLGSRVTALESSFATKVDTVDARVKAVEGDVSGAITSMESTLVRIQDRLHRAETTTDTALKALEHTFASLDERIDSVADMASPEKADAWKAELEARFDALAADLRENVEQSRRQLADEIERAAAGASPELMGQLESRVNALEAAPVVDQIDEIGAQVASLSEHMKDAEQQTASAIESVGEQVAGLSETLDQRVVESERRSAAAIEQVGEQVATAIKHVQARQEQGQRSLSERVAASEKRQEARLSDALCNISDRLAEMQNQTVTAVSPVQRAIVSLASRLEALEDFTTPPNADPVSEELPDMPELEIDTTPLKMNEIPVEEEAQEIVEPEPEPALSAQAEIEDFEEDEDFIAGLPDFDEEPEVAATDDSEFETDDVDVWEHLDAELDAEDTQDESHDVDEDYLAAPSESEPLETLLEEPAEEEPDPLQELGSWDDTQDEARDSDVFAFDGEVLEEIEPETEDEELAHNTEAFDPEIQEDGEEDPEQAKDYLSRARTAAIAAASDQGRDGRSRRGRRSAASAQPKAGGGSNKKIPVIAAASMFAIAAAGAGGWVALRGKQVVAETDTPSIATKSSLAEAQTEQVDEPSLTGIEFTETATTGLDDALFEEEGSAAGIEEPVAPIAEPVPVQIELPTIPNALTLQQAAENGNAIAEFQWGEARLEAQDLAVGADFISRAAQQGLPAAQYRLAKLHERGLGVPRDFVEARSWTERAANGGNIKAMHDLAVFFADGEGGPQSYAAAAEWFRKAADFGIVDSQYNLAVLYENGLGISPSQTEALYWYEVASMNGDASAPGNVATLREALPLDQAQQALRRASGWAQSPVNRPANGTFGTQTWERSSRAQVEAVQTVLNGLGYDAGTPDGIAGAGTRTAVRAFQADSGLDTTGVIDAGLVDALNAQVDSLSG